MTCSVKQQLIEAAKKLFDGRIEFVTSEDIGLDAAIHLRDYNSSNVYPGTGMDGDGVRMWLCLLAANAIEA